MSLNQCIEDILFEGLEQFDIKLTPDQLTTLTNDVELAVDMYMEHASYQVEYTNPLESEVKDLKKQVGDMYSRESYKNLEERLDEKDRTIHRLRIMLDDLRREMNQMRG